ncbi:MULTISPECIES: toxin [unclassified Fibrobacter]|uniref:toxin n=1 Tax=unclassified Fibrobacter TaxID=2634177 RepID=UPI000D6CE147|nr:MULTISPECIES: toxin [unclassified Fibrobacter]
MYIMHINPTIEWNAEKAKKLWEERGISFNEIMEKLKSGEFKVCPVDNQKDHKGQKMFLIEMNGYTHCVPFVETDSGVFLKTAFKSRKHQKEIL